MRMEQKALNWVASSLRNSSLDASAVGSGRASLLRGSVVSGALAACRFLLEGVAASQTSLHLGMFSPPRRFARVAARRARRLRGQGMRPPPGQAATWLCLAAAWHARRLLCSRVWEAGASARCRGFEGRPRLPAMTLVRGSASRVVILPIAILSTAILLITILLVSDCRSLLQ